MTHLSFRVRPEDRQGVIIPTTSIALSKLLRYGACALSGLLLVVSFPKLGWHVFAWIACSPLVAAAVTEPAVGRTFRYGYLSGIVFFLGSCYWFVGVMERYGGLSPVLALGVMALFVALSSLFFALYGLGLGWTAQRSQGLALGLSPFLWVSMELGRTYLLTGFPWNLLGYAVQGQGLNQLASYTAVYGVSFLAAGISALLAWAFLKPRQWRAKVALAAGAALLVVADRLANPSPLPQATKVAVLVQPDVPLEETALERWAPGRNPKPLEQLVAMTLLNLEPGERTSPVPPLLVWSENPAPFYFDRDPLFRASVEKMAREAKAYAVVGTVTFAGQGIARPKNSAVVLDPNGDLLFQYDKIRLVPFGEYVPWWAFPGQVGKITREVGDFVPGSNYGAARTRFGAVSVFICYEDIFPQLVRRLVPDGPGVLVNISNDAWYGDSAARFQHLEMARFRAIENGRFLLRATNDGITAVIDAHGRIVQELPRRKPMALHVHFNYLGKRTFYTAHGDVFGWGCVAMTVVLAAVGARRSKKGNQDLREGAPPSPNRPLPTFGAGDGRPAQGRNV